MTTPLDFSAALKALRDGKRLTRSGWHGKGQFIVLQVPDEHSKMTEPYIYIEWPTYGGAYPQRSRVTWTASTVDLLSVDWEIVE